jgi:membrane peptidoglycan carboxypeptidase
MTFPKVYPPRAPTAGASGPTALIVAQVKSELDADGFKGSLNTDGLTIQTTIDKSAQTDAVNAVTKAYANVSARNHGKLRQALVAVNPANGAVLAYYGGKNDKTSQRDYVQNWVAPGSSFKPFTLAAVLKANLEGKKPAYAINSTVDGSQPYTVDGLSPIHNDPSDLQYSYPQSITSAMTKSLNTAFARLAHAVGPGEVAAAARAAGVPARTTRSAPDPGQPTLEDKSGHTSVSIGFGAYPYTVRPLDQAVSFATLADGGVEHDSYLVNKVTDYSGKVLFVHKDAGRRAFDAKVANDTTLAMEGVAEWSRLSLDNGRKTAAKTGTVDHGAGSSDAWMVGFTPQVSVASWAGTDGVNSIYSDSGAPMYGRNNPGSAWKYFLDSYLKGKPDADLPSKQMIGKGSNGSSAPAPTTQSAVTAPTQTTRTARSTGATTATPSPTAPSSSSAPSTPPSTRSTSVASTPAPSSALPSSSPPPVSTVSTPSVVTSTAGR